MWLYVTTAPPAVTDRVPASGATPESAAVLAVVFGNPPVTVSGDTTVSGALIRPMMYVRRASMNVFMSAIRCAGVKLARSPSKNGSSSAFANVVSSSRLSVSWYAGRMSGCDRNRAIVGTPAAR